MAQPGLVVIAQAGATSLFVLRPEGNGTFTGAPEILINGVYGRLSAATLAPDGLLWIGTVNKAGGKPVPSDDRVIRIQPPGRRRREPRLTPRAGDRRSRWPWWLSRP